MGPVVLLPSVASRVVLLEFSPHHSASSAELDAEHTQKVLEMEHTQQLKLKERQKFFEEAFQQDMEQYLTTGYLQIADRRGELGHFRLPEEWGLGYSLWWLDPPKSKYHEDA